MFHRSAHDHRHANPEGLRKRALADISSSAGGYIVMRSPESRSGNTLESAASQAPAPLGRGSAKGGFCKKSRSLRGTTLRIQPGTTRSNRGIRLGDEMRNRDVSRQFTGVTTTAQGCAQGGTGCRSGCHACVTAMKTGAIRDDNQGCATGLPATDRALHGTLRAWAAGCALLCHSGDRVVGAVTQA